MSLRPELAAAHDLPPFLRRQDLACLDVNPEIFYPPSGGDGATEARRICRRCPVTDECLVWAVETGQSWGVWGGKTGKERHAIRRTLKEPL